jgi:hypothetical protein
MKTLLRKEQVDLIRSIGDAANVLIALWMIDQLYPGRSTTAQELADILHKDKRSVENRLKSLCGSNRAIYDGHGYVLMEGGRALFLPIPLSNLESGDESTDGDIIEVLAQSPIDISGAALSDGLEGHPQSRQEIVEAPKDQALQTDDLPPMPEMPDMDESLAHFVHEREEEHTRAMRALLEEVNLINQESLKSDSSSDSRSTQNVRADVLGNSQNPQPPKPNYQPTTLQILDATEALWQKTMTTSGIADKPKRMAIGWVAQAWDQRKHLRSPQGLIYAKLNKGEKPQQKYYDRPCDYLPDHYLMAIGIMAPRPAEEPESIAPEPDSEIMDPVGESLEESVGPHCWMSPRQAWEAVLGNLKEDMHRAPFETWVRDTRAVRFDGNTLYVGTKSSYGREWLEDRMQSTVERLLVGIMNDSVKVKFVVVSSLGE